MHKYFYKCLLLGIVIGTSAQCWAGAPDSVASGAWMNKYFVDFDNDWQTDVQDYSQRQPTIYTYISGERDDNGDGFIRRRAIIAGPGLVVRDKKLHVDIDNLAADAIGNNAPAYTQGNNIQINGTTISKTDTKHTSGVATSITSNNKINILTNPNKAMKIGDDNKLYIGVDNKTLCYDCNGNLRLGRCQPCASPIDFCINANNITGYWIHYNVIPADLLTCKDLNTTMACDNNQNTDNLCACNYYADTYNADTSEIPNGGFSVYFSYGTVTGIASCNSTIGDNNANLWTNPSTAVSESMSSNDTGKYCWCKLTSIAGSVIPDGPWMFSDMFNNATTCEVKCTVTCALRLAGDNSSQAIYRPKLYMLSGLTDSGTGSCYLQK